MKMEKNRELDVLVEDLSPQAQGVAKADGFVVFVPGALPGERWRVKIIKVTAQYAVGRPLKRLGKPWAHRVEPPCPRLPAAAYRVFPAAPAERKDAG